METQRERLVRGGRARKGSGGKPGDAGGQRTGWASEDERKARTREGDRRKTRMNEAVAESLAETGGGESFLHCPPGV